MQKWLRRIRNVVAMGLTWAVGWALLFRYVARHKIPVHARPER